ncbi:MAG: zf-HC2 domain-containing protein [Planctomycetes bacterium]|nr:zf-HC2 domain-containing protein [Planctomycetota bacterium]
MSPRARCHPLFEPRAEGGGSGPLPEADAVLLSAYLDGELDAAERAALDRRLESEPGLKAELEALRASHDVLQAAAGPGRETIPARSDQFATFGSRLAQADPGELPVAAALQPSKFRRAFILFACVVAALIALGFAGRVMDRMAGPKPSGWSLTAPGAKITFIRAGRVMTVQGHEAFLAGDRLLLDAQAAAELHGPEGLKAVARGPATLTLERFALYLEEGKLTVEGEGPAAAQILNLRTPDGAVRPKANDGPFRFEVEAPARPKS